VPSRYNGTPEEQRALDAYIKLQRAAETVTVHTTRHLAGRGLTVSQFAVLEALHHLGTLSQRDLADKLLKSTGNMSIVLKALEQRGFVSRVRDPGDNRYMQVCITAAGRRFLMQFFPEHVHGIVEEMSVLSAKEQEELARLCRKLGLREAPQAPDRSGVG
jgi:MarR family 2-MHQ and catechol resistance regulon transcriptional repressor